MNKETREEQEAYYYGVFCIICVIVMFGCFIGCDQIDMKARLTSAPATVVQKCTHSEIRISQLEKIRAAYDLVVRDTVPRKDEIEALRKLVDKKERKAALKEIDTWLARYEKLPFMPNGTDSVDEY